MSEDWIPFDRRPISVPPTQQEVENARDLCFKLLDTTFALFQQAGMIADTWDKVHSDVEKRKPHVMTMPAWARVTVDEFREIQKLIDQADEHVRKWALFFDRFAVDVLNVGVSCYSNAPLAIIGIASEFIERTDAARDSLEKIDPNPQMSDRVPDTLAKTARLIWNAGISVVGADFPATYSRIQAKLRVEVGRAWEKAERTSPTSPVIPQPPLTYEEGQIIDTLRKANRRMTQIKLLDKAGLGQHGTSKSLLSQMRQRGLINNDRDEQGRGYGLPEWKRKEAKE